MRVYPTQPGDRTETDAAMKHCPQCAEDIRREATKCRYCQFEFVGPSEGEIISGWIRSHPTVTLALVTFLYVTFQVYKAGDFEVNVELIRSSGLTSILTGVLLQQLPFLLLLLGFGACWWLISFTPGLPALAPEGGSGLNPRMVATDPRIAPQVLLAALLVMGFYTIPWPLFLVSVLSSVTAVVIAHRRKDGRRWTAILARRAMALLSVLLVGWLVYTHATIWVPSENVTTEERGTVVAFVIAENDQWTTLLTPQWTGYLDPRENSVLRLPTRSITARELCSMNLLEAQVFGRVLRLRPVQIVDALEQRKMPEPSQRRACANHRI